jgi:hypothetical protein
MCTLYTSTSSIKSSSVKIFSLTISIVVSTEGVSSSKLKFILKFRVNSCESIVPLHTSSSKYQFFGILPRLCIRKCVHGTNLHVSMHSVTCYIGKLNPIYLCGIYSNPNITCATLFITMSFLSSPCVQHTISPRSLLV